MVVAWVLFPLVFLAVCTGCGLAVERVGGWDLPGGLLPPIGLALIILVSSLTTMAAATAPLSPVVVVVLAIAGYAGSRQRLRLLRPDPWMLAVGLGVYAICAAPVVLSGNATFLGYFVDSDPAFHFELISWLLAHGRDLTGQPAVSPSAVANLLREYIGTDYPTGSDVALGAVRPLVGQDVAWIYQPYLAVVMALAALSLHELLRGVVRSRPLRALCAFAAVQGGLAYAFYLEASIKELVTTVLIAVAVTLVLEALRRPARVRTLAPLAVVAVAALDVYSLAIVPWLGVPLAVLVLTAAWRARWVVWRRPAWRPTGRDAAWPAAGILVLASAAPALRGASTFATVAGNVLSQQNALGNLAAPLKGWQVLGIWPSGDFRYPIASDYQLAYVLMGIALAGAALGVVWLLRRRALAPLLLLAGDGIATAYLLHRSSPYAASKVLMLVSVAVVLTAMLGAAALHDSGRRIEGWALAAVVTAGVLWTNVLAYHDSSVAPQGRLKELAAIGSHFSGRGPAFYNLWDTFAVYFLREEAVAVPGTFAGLPPAAPGLPGHSFGQMSTAWDPNELDPSYLQQFRLLILGRSPALSRPPADYRLVYQGHYYDVWQRTATPLVHTHIGVSGGSLADTPHGSCQRVMFAAALAKQQHARLGYVIRPSWPTLVPTRATHPQSWAPTRPPGSRGNDFLSMAQFPGVVTGDVRVPAAGSYQVWVEGSFSRRVTVWVGQQYIGSLTHQIGIAGQFLLAGTVRLSAGSAPVLIVRPDSGASPGDVLGGDMLGRIVLKPEGSDPAVGQIAPSHARSLCGKPLEWVEVLS